MYLSISQPENVYSTLSHVKYPLGKSFIVKTETTNIKKNTLAQGTGNQVQYITNPTTFTVHDKIKGEMYL